MRIILIILSALIALFAFSVTAIPESRSNEPQFENNSSQEVPLNILYFEDSGADTFFPLEKNNSSISSQNISSIGKDFKYAYNKDYELYSPIINNQLIHRNFFALNKTVNCTVMLSYYGNIGFLFQESDIYLTRIVYLGANQSGTFSGLPFTRYLTFDGVRVFGPNRYGVVTNVNNLSRNIVKRYATYYYLNDFAHYYVENKSLNEDNDPKFQKLVNFEYKLENETRSAKNMYEASNATVNFYKSVRAIGYSDRVINNIVDDLETKNLLGTNPTILPTTIVLVPDKFAFSRFIIEILAIILLLCVIIIWIELWKNQSNSQTQIDDRNIVSKIFDVFLSIVALTFIKSLIPNEMPRLYWAMTIFLLLIEIFLILKIIYPCMKQLINNKFPNNE